MLIQAPRLTGSQVLIKLRPPACTRTLSIVYEADPVGSAIENVTVDTNANKVIKDGQLFIMKEGIRYNVLGTVVK